MMLGLVPWLAGLAGLSAGMLWFVQRPWPLRLLAWSVAALWSLFWGWRSASARADGAFRQPAIWLAAGCALLGSEGATFGLSPAGVFASVLLSAAAAALWAAANGSTTVGRMKAVAIALATFAALAGTEAVVRVAGLGATGRESDSRELARQFNNITPPGSVFVNQPKPLDEFPPALVEINSVGTRGPELARAPVDVLLLGDSFVEARQLPWDQTIGPRLQAALAGAAPGTRVVAHGMRGWSPLLEWNWYLKVGRQLHPRLVLLFFFWNDLWVVGTEAETFRAVVRPDGRPDHFDAQVDAGWIWYKPLRTLRLVDEIARLATAGGARRMLQAAAAGTSRSVSGLDQAAAERMARRMTSERPLTPDEVQSLLGSPVGTLAPDLQQVARLEFWPGMRPLELWTADQRQAANHTETELKAFAADVAADGGRLVIVYVPNAYQIGPAECSVGRLLNRMERGVVLPPDSGIQTWLRTMSARNGIELLDPSDAMRRASITRASGGQPPLYLRADCHWSAAGHQFLADWLADWYVRLQRGR